MGVVECVRAGAGVSEFRVVEAWKGRLPNDTCNLEWSVPCGERLLVTLRESRSGLDPAYLLYWMLSPSGGLERIFEAWPTRQSGFASVNAEAGLVTLPYNKKRAWHPYGGHLTDIGAFRAATLSLLSAGPEMREVMVMRGIALLFMLGEASVKMGATPEMTLLEEILENATSPAEVINPLLMLAQQYPEKWQHEVEWALVRGGGEHTLACLHSVDTQARGASGEWLPSVIQKLEARIAEPKKQASGRWLGGLPFDPDNVDEVREFLLSRGPLGQNAAPSYPWCHAFTALARAEPLTCARYLRDLDAIQAALGRKYLTYNLACHFVQFCPRDHAKCFRELAKSDIPAIKAVGALRLAFEKPRRGTEALKQLAREDTEWGTWAAAYLVALGDAGYVDQTLELYNRNTRVSEERLYFCGIGRKVMAVLSNAAKDAGVPQPSSPYTIWWATHRDTLKLQPLPYEEHALDEE